MQLRLNNSIMWSKASREKVKKKEKSMIKCIESIRISMNSSIFQGITMSITGKTTKLIFKSLSNVIKWNLISKLGVLTHLNKDIINLQLLLYAKPATQEDTPIWELNLALVELHNKKKIQGFLKSMEAVLLLILKQAHLKARVQSVFQS